MPIFRIFRSDGTQEVTDKTTLAEATAVAQRTSPADPVSYTVFDSRGDVVDSGLVP